MYWLIKKRLTQKGKVRKIQETKWLKFGLKNTTFQSSTGCTPKISQGPTSWVRVDDVLDFQASSPIRRLGYTRNRSPFAELLTTVNRFLGAHRKNYIIPKARYLEITKISYRPGCFLYLGSNFTFYNLEAIVGIFLSFKPFRFTGFRCLRRSTTLPCLSQSSQAPMAWKGNSASESWNKSKASSVLTRKMDGKKTTRLHKVPLYFQIWNTDINIYL